MVQLVSGAPHRMLAVWFWDNDDGKTEATKTQDADPLQRSIKI